MRRLLWSLSALIVALLTLSQAGGRGGIAAADMAGGVLDPAAATSRHGWSPTRSPESIFEEIACHAERHPDWLDRCGG